MTDTPWTETGYCRCSVVVRNFVGLCVGCGKMPITPAPQPTAHERSLIRVTCERDAAITRAVKAEAIIASCRLTLTSQGFVAEPLDYVMARLVEIAQQAEKDRDELRAALVELTAADDNEYANAGSVSAATRHIEAVAAATELGRRLRDSGGGK